MNPRDPEKLERFVHQALRDLPARRAPHSLEGRVLAAIAARAALPWWRQAFPRWPGWAQVAFVAAAVGAIKLLAVGPVFMIGDLRAAPVAQLVLQTFAWLGQARSLIDGLGEAGRAVIHAIPPLWFYGTLALVGSLYLALVGLGAAAYRTLYAQR